MRNRIEFSASKFMEEYKYFKNTDVLIAFEKVANLFLTRPGTNFEDKNYGCNIYQFIGRHITPLLLKEVKTECYRVIGLYLPQYAQALTVDVVQSKTNEFVIKLSYDKYYITLSSDSL